MIIIGHLLYIAAAIYIETAKETSEFLFYGFLVFGALYLWIGLWIYQLYLYVKSFFK